MANSKTETKKEKVVVIQPVISEKSYALANQLNKYVFMINTDSNKIEVAKAIEDKYGVKVLAVNTVVKPGKSKTNWQYNITHRKSDRKKAIVTLKDGDKIDEFFNL